MIRKGLFFLTLFLFITIHAFGQKPKVKNKPTYNDRPIHFGFTIGLNSMDYSVSSVPFNQRVAGDSIIADVLQPQPGFHVSMVSSFRINDYLTFRFLPGLSFGQRNLYFFNLTGNKSLGSSGRNINQTMIIESSYIEFPALIKYRAKRVNNFGPYLIGGVNFRYDIAARKQFAEDSEVFLIINPFDVFYEAGLGFDFYLPYFKFSTEIKLSAGITDVLSHRPHEEFPQYSNSIQKLTSNLIMVSFHFE